MSCPVSHSGQSVSYLRYTDLRETKGKSMKIIDIQTYAVGAGWKNWLFVKVLTDAGLEGLGEGTLNGFIKTTEAGVHELKHLAIGQDPRRIRALAKRLLDSVSLDGGHIHRTVIA